MTPEDIIQMRIDLTVAGHDSDTSPQHAATMFAAADMIRELAEKLRLDEGK